jgi:hypothetical protein
MADILVARPLLETTDVLERTLGVVRGHESIRARAARHADPRTTMRYDRARNNLDRHPNYILAPTWPPAPDPIERAGLPTSGRRVAESTARTNAPGASVTLETTTTG